MQKTKTLEDVYNQCSSEGAFIDITQENTQKIRSLIENAEICIESAKTLMKGLSKQDRKWMVVYTQYYEAIKIYAEALVNIGGKKISNHRCLFAFLCTRHPDLEFSWDFFEKVRTKRNGVNYYGDKITYDDWKSIEFQIKLYISTPKKIIEKKLSEV